MSTYSDIKQRDLDRASGEAIDRRPSIKELAEHYDGRVPQWFIDEAERLEEKRRDTAKRHLRLMLEESQRLADEEYCADHCQSECREWEDCSLVGGCPLLRNK